MIQIAVSAYKRWHVVHERFPKPTKFSLGVGIDRALVELLECLFSARFAKGERKTVFIQQAGAKLELVKFLLQVSWELECMDTKTFSELIEPLEQIGRMIGGWYRHESEAPHKSGA